MRHTVPALLISIAAALPGCGGDTVVDPTEAGAGTGTVKVTVTTTGEQQSGEYTVRLDQGEPRYVLVNGTLSLTEVDAGSHNVLLELPFGCRVETGNPRSVEVEADTTVTVAFVVACTFPTGVELSIQTHGELTGPGYTVVVDGNEVGPVQRIATMRVGDLSAGPHTIGLTDLPANCTMAGDNPRTVNLIPGQMSVFYLDVNCIPIPPPPSGGLLVYIHSIGHAPEFQLVVDGLAGPVPAELNEYFIVENVPIGVRSVLLSGVPADRCDVVGDNPKKVQVNIDSATFVGFEVLCEPYNNP